VILFKNDIIMNKNILKLGSKVLLCSALLLGASACSNFLDEEDPTNLDPDKFYTAPKHAEAALNAVYADTRFYGDGAGIFASNWQLLEAPTGTATTETAQNSDLNNLYSLTYDPNTGHNQNWWRGVYKIIGNANLVITKTPGIAKMDEVARKKIIGEASFLRAWAYFYAVRLWGEVPIELEPHYVLTERAYPSRSSVQEVYDLIVADLQVAEAAGLNWTETSGRVSTAAVKSLLAKVYLTMAGEPLKKGLPYYTLAAAKAKEVIDNAGTAIDLFGTYNEIHDEANNNRKEHIFMIQYTQDVAANPMTNMFPNFKPITHRGNSGTGSTIPRVDFYNSFETGDRRAVSQHGWFYTSWYKDGVGPAVVELGAPYIFKHFNVKANGGGPSVAPTKKDNLNVPVIRYAEVLLIYAEAQNASPDGLNQLAYDSYKRIRDRAQLTTPALATFTKETFQEAVWRERWYELCFEGITWFDMVRLQKVFNHATKGFDNFVGHQNSTNATLQAKHLLFPIPRQEIISNPKLKPQNDGYPEEF
jgi:hypothetical protein